MADKRQFKNGTYTARVLSSTVGPAGSKGTQCAEIQCQLLDHTDAAGVKAPVESNFPVLVQLWITETVGDKPGTIDSQVFKDQIEALDLSNGLLSLLNNEIAGKEIQLYCRGEVNTQSGDTYDRFSISTGKGGARSFVKAPANTDSIKKLNALLGFKSKPAAETVPNLTVEADSF